MKTLVKFYLVFCLTVVSFAQNNCETYFPFTKDVTFEMTSYDKKGKVESITSYRVSDVSGNTANYDVTISDKKGKEVLNTTYTLECSEEAISIDFKSLMNSQMLEQYKDMDLEFTGTNVEIPKNLSVGQELKDAEMKMTVSVTGMNMNMNMYITERKVIAKETVTVPAGTFDCYVITYNTEVKMGMIKNKSMTKEWIAEGIGFVRSEFYNKKGKSQGYTELTAFNK